MAGRLTAQTDGVDAVGDTAGPAARGPIRAAGGVVTRPSSPTQPPESPYRPSSPTQPPESPFQPSSPTQPPESPFQPSSPTQPPEVLLVHRPRFDDWSLPKGKLKRREHPLVGAVREVFEETAVRAVPGIRLPTVRYQVWADRGSRAGPPGGGRSLADKQVEYWAMTVGETHTFAPTDEVDDLAWLSVPRALAALTYPHDREVVGAYGDLPPLHRPVVLLRHANEAPAGQREGAVLATLLSLLRPARLISAHPLRCRQTLAGLAETLGLDVEIHEDLNGRADPGALAGGLRRLANPDTVTVVCSSGGPIQAAVTTLTGRRDATHPVAPGDALVLSFAGDTLIAADPLTPAVS